MAKKRKRAPVSLQTPGSVVNTAPVKSVNANMMSHASIPSASLMLDHGIDPASMYGVKRARVDDSVNVQFSSGGYSTFPNAIATQRPDSFAYTPPSLGHVAHAFDTNGVTYLNAGVSTCTSLPGLTSAVGTFGSTWMTNAPSSAPVVPPLNIFRDKSERALAICMKVYQMMSHCSDDQFSQRLSIMEQLYEAWHNGKMTLLTCLDTEDENNDSEWLLRLHDMKMAGKSARTAVNGPLYTQATKQATALCGNSKNQSPSVDLRMCGNALQMSDRPMLNQQQFYWMPSLTDSHQTAVKQQPMLNSMPLVESCPPGIADGRRAKAGPRGTTKQDILVVEPALKSVHASVNGPEKVAVGILSDDVPKSRRKLHSQEESQVAKNKVEVDVAVDGDNELVAPKRSTRSAATEPSVTAKKLTELPKASKQLPKLQTSTKDIQRTVSTRRDTVSKVNANGVRELTVRILRTVSLGKAKPKVESASRQSSPLNRRRFDKQPVKSKLLPKAEASSAASEKRVRPNTNKTKMSESQVIVQSTKKAATPKLTKTESLPENDNKTAAVRQKAPPKVQPERVACSKSPVVASDVKKMVSSETSRRSKQSAKRRLKPETNKNSCAGILSDIFLLESFDKKLMQQPFIHLKAVDSNSIKSCTGDAVFQKNSMNKTSSKSQPEVVYSKVIDDVLVQVVKDSDGAVDGIKVEDDSDVVDDDDTACQTDSGGVVLSEMVDNMLVQVVRLVDASDDEGKADDDSTADNYEREKDAESNADVNVESDDEDSSRQQWTEENSEQQEIVNETAEDTKVEFKPNEDHLDATKSQTLLCEAELARDHPDATESSVLPCEYLNGAQLPADCDDDPVEEQSPEDVQRSEEVSPAVDCEISADVVSTDTNRASVDRADHGKQSEVLNHLAAAMSRDHENCNGDCECSAAANANVSASKSDCVIQMFPKIMCGDDHPKKSASFATCGPSDVTEMLESSAVFATETCLVPQPTVAVVPVVNEGEKTYETFWNGDLGEFEVL